MTRFSIAIVGAGFAGLGLAIRLKQCGISDFVVLERAGDVGGTWRDNTYPGCTCDVESHLYSFSFAPNPSWSRMWSPQPEILAYLQGCARRFDIIPHVRFHHTFEGAQWDAGSSQWDIKTSKGKFQARFLVSAMGALSEPHVPPLPGLSEFEGKFFHSAQWDHQYDLKGKRVAVIGTGASAIQFIPAIQPLVQKLTVFQRTAPWVIPYNNRALTAREKKIFARFPLAQKLWRLRVYLLRELMGVTFRHPRLMGFAERLGRSYLARKVKDPELRRKLTPTFLIGCKRILISRGYYPALTQPNVEVVTEGIQRFTPQGIVATGGKEYSVDAVILGTGFQLAGIHAAHAVRGRGGKLLADAWKGSPKAHLGTTVAGFPNFFTLFGPSTGLGHSSVMLMAEAQIDHFLNAYRYAQAKGVAALEPKAEAQEAFAALVDKKMQGTVWTSGCASWYLDSTGRNSTLWPGSVGSFRRRVRKFRPSEYQLEH